MLFDTAPAYPPQQEYVLSPGREGVIETLKIMRRLVREYKKNPGVRGKAIEILQFTPEKNWSTEAEMIFRYVRDQIRYTLDINGVETLQTPIRTLELGAGDCDDKALLLASLLESAGHPTRFKAVGFEPGDLTHVYVQTAIGDPRDPSSWFSLDAAEPGAPFGWEPPDIVEKFIVNN